MATFKSVWYKVVFPSKHAVHLFSDLDVIIFVFSKFVKASRAGLDFVWAIKKFSDVH
jgi:hypothetical protein